MNGKYGTEASPRENRSAAESRFGSVVLCSPGSCREEMRGRVILRYRETSAPLVCGEFGWYHGSLVSFRPLLWGMKGLFCCPSPHKTVYFIGGVKNTS